MHMAVTNRGVMNRSVMNKGELDRGAMNRVVASALSLPADFAQKQKQLSVAPGCLRILSS